MTPWPPPVPTASQLVGVAQETARRDFVPATTCAVPGMPLVMVTTTPWPLSEFDPTASHSVVVGHEIAVSWATPETACREATATAVPGVVVEVDDDGEELPHAASTGPSATAAISTNRAAHLGGRPCRVPCT